MDVLFEGNRIKKTEKQAPQSVSSTCKKMFQDDRPYYVEQMETKIAVNFMPWNSNISYIRPSRDSEST